MGAGTILMGLLVVAFFVVAIVVWAMEDTQGSGDLEHFDHEPTSSLD